MRKSRFISILVPFLCIAGCVLFSIFGVRNIKARATYIKTDAEIVSITREYVDSETTNTNVFVSYTVDGEEYTSELGEYSANMYEGKTVGIMYDPDNPQTIIASGLTAPIMMFLVAVICLVSALISGVKLMQGRL